MLMILIFGLLGLAFGSFVNALVWRLHERRDFVSERSECVKCHHQLAWYDLIPVVSWVLLRGKCRYCKKSISVQYPAVELATSALFVISYVFWPLNVSELAPQILLGIWCIMLVILMALLVYDARWYLLPDKLTYPLIALAAVFGTLYQFVVVDASVLQVVSELTLGMVSVAGLYYVLYAYSKGKWVGFGDVKLGIAMGLILGWQLGLLSVFLANLIGLIYILPGMLGGKLTPQSKIPFGPFLIVGLIVAYLFGAAIVDWYVGTILMF